MLPFSNTKQAQIELLWSGILIWGVRIIAQPSFGNAPIDEKEDCSDGLTPLWD